MRTTLLDVRRGRRSAARPSPFSRRTGRAPGAIRAVSPHAAALGLTTRADQPAQFDSRIVRECRPMPKIRRSRPASTGASPAWPSTRLDRPGLRRPRRRRRVGEPRADRHRGRRRRLRRRSPATSTRSTSTTSRPAAAPSAGRSPTACSAWRSPAAWPRTPPGSTPWPSSRSSNGSSSSRSPSATPSGSSPGSSRSSPGPGAAAGVVTWHRRLVNQRRRDGPGGPDPDPRPGPRRPATGPASPPSLT